MLTMVPRTFTDLYNYISNHTGEPVFEWVKKRKIVFIPKSGKPKNQVDSYQPISLLEIFYKIGAKILKKRTGKMVTVRISRTQFGFIPTKTYLHTIIRRVTESRCRSSSWMPIQHLILLPQKQPQKL